MNFKRLFKAILLALLLIAIILVIILIISLIVSIIGPEFAHIMYFIICFVAIVWMCYDLCK